MEVAWTRFADKLPSERGQSLSAKRAAKSLP
jgi:hypothetical protein